MQAFANLEDPAAAICPFRWQTKYFDNETGLYYFGYRFFDSLTGRWLSRDPLAENGGVNLYAFCNNDPVNGVDGLGLWGESLWYDRLGTWAGNKVDTAKDYYANNLPWVISGILNTAIDIVSGPAHIPSAIGHLGEGTGRFSADPSWENAPGMLMDVSTTAGVMAAGLSALPSGRAPIGINTIANPVPSSVARVVPGNTTLVNLGRTGAADVFVTAADDIVGMNAAKIQQRLAIKPSSSYTVIEFPTPSSGLASPINRSDPGFVGGGRTAGGAREFVLPNSPLPPGATIRRVQ